MKKITHGLIMVSIALTGCKYYGSALPPEYPMSMDDASAAANDLNASTGGMQRPVIKQSTRPRIERPSYLPEKELAIVSPPQTLLVWTYPYVTDDNTRQFGNWATLFLQDRYEWVRPSNQVGLNDDDAGSDAGRPNLDQDIKNKRDETLQPAPGSQTIKLKPTR